VGGDDEGTVAREDRVQATARTAVTEDEQRTAAGGQEHGRTSSELTWTAVGRSRGEENDGGGEGNELMGWLELG